MRRKDREIAEIKELETIVTACRICRLGLWDGHEPYIVPMNFGYERTGEGWTFYFHAAKEGRKLDVLRSNPIVALEMDGNHALKEAAQPCGYGYRYESVMGVGVAQIIDDPDEKKQALTLIMERQTGRLFEFNHAMAASVTVIKVTAETLSGKRNIEAQ